MQRWVVNGSEEGLWWFHRSDDHWLSCLPWTLPLLLLCLCLHHCLVNLGDATVPTDAGSDRGRGWSLGQEDDLILRPCTQRLGEARWHIATGGCVDAVLVVAVQPKHLWHLQVIIIIIIMSIFLECLSM